MRVSLSASKAVMRLALAALASLIPASAHAWTRPAHMVSAAIAYDDLKASNPKLLATLGDLLDHHPDRGAFEVAIDRTTGEDRAKRMFYECARWPDDARGTPYDHPTWHYAARPITTDGTTATDQIEGSAIEAFALNVRVLGDDKASKSERAVALCWMMHIIGDIHQPLHAGQQVSRAHPEGDQLGGRQFVREAESAEPVTLHWYWDDSVHRSGQQASVEQRARALAARFARPAARGSASDFPTWAEESYALARSATYSKELTASSNPAAAPIVTVAYRASTVAVAESRLVLAGYRLADVLREASGDQAAR